MSASSSSSDVPRTLGCHVFPNCKELKLVMRPVYQFTLDSIIGVDIPFESDCTKVSLHPAQQECHKSLDHHLLSSFYTHQ